MRKRIISLLLAVLMILAVIPAMSLAASADDTATVSDPAVGTYDYYADRGMWYGTGSQWTSDDTPLMSFVDMTHLPETGWSDQNRAYEITNSAVRATYLNFPGNSAYHNSTGNSNVRSYVRITGGRLKGNFYPISVNAGASVSPVENLMTRDAYGNMVYAPSTAAEMRLGGSGYIFGTVLVTSTFSSVSTGDVENKTYDHWSLTPTGATYNKEDCDYSKLFDDYMDPTSTPNAKYSIEHTARVYSDATTTQSIKDGIASSFPSSWNKLNFFAKGTETYVSGNPNALLNVLALDLGAGAVIKGVNFNGTQAKAITDGSALGTKAFSASAAVTVAYDTADSKADIGWKLMTEDAGLVTRNDKDIALATKDAISLIPKSSHISQTLFIRVYNTTLTDEQFKQNHLADLMYYYNIDLKDRVASDFVGCYDAAMQFSVGLHNDGADEQAEYDRTVAALNSMVDTLFFDDSVVGTYEYYANRGMWYGTGSQWTSDDTPLMSFVDLTHVPDNADAWKAQISPGGKANDGVILLYPWSNGNSAFHMGTDGVGVSTTHPYIRIKGGQLAGSFYPLSPIGGSLGGLAAADMVTRDAYGNMKYVTTHENMRPGVSMYIAGTVLVTSTFVNGVTADVNDVGDKWSINKGASSFETVAQDGDYSVFLDNWMDPAVTENVEYSIEHVARIGGDAAAVQPTLDGIASAYPTSGRKINLFATGMETGISGNTAAMISPFSMDLGAGGIFNGVTFNGTQATTVANGSSLTDIRSATAYVSVDYTNATTADMGYKLMTADTGIVSRNDTGVALTQEQALTLVPKASMVSQSLFMRVYNTTLTDEQFKQNHLADLMYYYNIELDGVSAADLAIFYDRAMPLNVGLHYDLNPDDDVVTAENEEYDRVVGELNAMVAQAKDFNAVKTLETVASLGFQAKTSDNIGVRSIFTLNKASLATLKETYNVEFTGYILDASGTEIGSMSIQQYFDASEIENYTDVDADAYDMFALTLLYVNPNLTDSPNYASFDTYHNTRLTYVIKMTLTDKTSGSTATYTFVAESDTLGNAVSAVDVYNAVAAKDEMFKETTAYKAYKDAVDRLNTIV